MPELLKSSINPDLWIDDATPHSTPMRDFYRGKTVFLTGGSGFLGQIYVEKLLRCGVKTLYLLARSKKGKSGIQRLTEMYTGALFTLLDKQDPNYMSRVRVIDGNTRDINVGLSDDARREIVENVEIIIHAAADVRFDNTLKESCLINLRGTREMMEIAAECKKLQMFAYISTAFSQCIHKVIDEQFYPVTIDPEEMIKIAEHFDKSDKNAELLDILTESFIRPWPNTYSFSKALCEELVRQYGSRVPCVIIRPSIIISTHEDPVPAWCNNIYGLNGMLVACGLGFLRIMVFDPKLKGDIICADFVTNSTLAVIWYRHNELEELKRSKLSEKPLLLAKSEPRVTDELEAADTSNNLEPKIYNVTSKNDGVTWGDISDDMYNLLLEYPTVKSIWLHTPSTTRYRLIEFFLVIFYHAIPGLLYDLVLKVVNNPRRLLPLYRKTHLFMVKLRYFMTREWTFGNKNIRQVYESMSVHDQKYFPSDVRKYNWNEYRYNYHLGLLRYIGGESLEDFQPARRRMLKFKIAHFFVLCIYYPFLASLAYCAGYLFGVNNLIRSMYNNWF